jgi:hypothetical protein
MHHNRFWTKYTTLLRFNISVEYRITTVTQEKFLLVFHLVVINNEALES